MSSTMREGSSMQFMPPDLDETVATYIKNLEDNIRNMENKMIELNGGLTQIKSGIPGLRESLESKQAFRQDFTNEAKKIAEAEERVERLEEEKRNVDWQLAKFQQSMDKKENEMSTLSVKLRQTEADLKSTQTRLSEVMGNKLMDNNPDIADLSDQHRPSKLAEKYMELYDNEWTDAFEAIQNIKQCDDQRCVLTLLALLRCTNTFCTKKWQAYMNGFNHDIKRGKEFCIPDYINKQLKDIAKSFAPRMVDDIFKEFKDETTESTTRESNRAMLKSDNVQGYLKVCVEVCWMMAAQDPPVVFEAGHKPGDKMDITVFKAYTQNGDTIEFLVWPPLFLHEDGPLLTKGVAQAVGSRRCQSAPAKSRDNTRGTDNLLRLTTHSTPKIAWSTTEENSPITVHAQTSTNMETEDTPQIPVLFQLNQNNYQQTNVNTGSQGQTGISSTNSYQQQPPDRFFDNKARQDNTNTSRSNFEVQQYHMGQNLSYERQQQLHMQSGTQQQQQQQLLLQQQQQQQQYPSAEHIQWKHTE